MATITVNVENETADVFRKRAYELYGKKKGVLGRAVNEAMTEWSRKKEFFDKCMQLLEKGIDMGKLKYKTRAELHERN